MFNPVGNKTPAPAAAVSNNNKRKETETTELEDLQKYFVSHKPSDQWWQSYLIRLTTLQEQTKTDDPQLSKINELVAKCFAQIDKVPAAASNPADEPAARDPKSKKGMTEEKYKKTYSQFILPNQIKSINENVNNNAANPNERQERKAAALLQLANLFAEFPENKEIAALYQKHFQDVVPEGTSVQATPQRVRTALAQQLSDQYDALRKDNYEKEMVPNDRFEALCQLQGLPMNNEISRMDERYIEFSKSIDKVISLLDQKPLDVLSIITELSKETKSPRLEEVRKRIIQAIESDNSSAVITKEWLRVLLQECSYGLEDASLDATPEQIRLLIEKENIRHARHMEKLELALNAVNDVSYLLNFSAKASHFESNLPGSEKK